MSVPTGIVSTGWPSVAKTCRDKLGIEFDEWQHGAGRLILSKRANGKLATTISGVGMSLPRQIGKTYLMAGLLFALCVEQPGLLAIWSAHHSRTHAETFVSMQGFAERARIRPHIRNVYTGSGDEEVRFHNGSRILFGARERGFGRGIPGVDVLVFDEAQILSDRALSNMVATMNTSQFGLHMYIGTPPRPGDDSEAFKRMRLAALEHKLPNGAWIECGSDHGVDPDDRTQWAKANPSYPHRTPVEAFLRLREKLTDEDYLREAMGVWDPTDGNEVIDAETWHKAADPTSMAIESLSLAVDVSPDRKTASVALAGLRADGRWHVELDEQRRGVDWITPWVRARCERNQIRAVVVDAMSPAGSLVDEMERAKIRVTTTSARDMAAACGTFYDAVVTPEPRLVHTDQPQVNYSLSVARKRPIGDGGWGWNRKAADSDITPIVAVTLALWGAQNSNVKRPVRSGVKSKVVVL